MSVTTAPTMETFFLLSTSTNAPLTGFASSLSFSSYTNEAGTPITPQPTIVEIGGGLYGFTISFPSPSNHGVCYVLNATSGANPQYIYRYARPTDWTGDLVPDIHTINTGKWQIFTSGMYQNQLVLFDTDGSTVLYAFNLYDSSGSPTSINPFVRTPT